MKIDRPTIWNSQEPLTEKTESTPKAPGKVVEQKATEPVELQRSPLPKTDTVEMKTDSLYNFDAKSTGPTLDPSQTNIANAKGVPATLIPGVPFREKVELPKTLPNGSSVDTGLGSGDLGLGRNRTGPNHMGVDMKGTQIKNQLDDALKLKEGSQTPTAAPNNSVVNFNSIGGSHGREDKTYHGGLNFPGMDKKSVGEVDRNPFKTLTKLPEIVEKVTGRAADFLDGIKALVNPQEQEKKYLNEKEGDGIQPKEYVNPDAPEGTQAPVITDETLEKVGVRLGSNKQPVPDEYLQDEIDGKILSGSDPRRTLISNPLPDDGSQVTPGSGESVQISKDAKGPDTVNPNDPDLGSGGDPIIINPNRPK